MNWISRLLRITVVALISLISCMYIPVVNAAITLERTTYTGNGAATNPVTVSNIPIEVRVQSTDANAAMTFYLTSSETFEGDTSNPGPVCYSSSGSPAVITVDPACFEGINMNGIYNVNGANYVMLILS